MCLVLKTNTILLDEKEGPEKNGVRSKFHFLTQTLPI